MWLQLAQQDVACHTFCKGTYQQHSAMGINNMKRVLLGGLLAIASMQAAPAVAVTPVAGESVLTMRVDGELTIGTEGQVVAYNIRSKLDPALQALLDKTIPRWHLAPVRQGGKSVNAKTPMRITLAATQIPQGYEVRLDNVVFTPISKEDHEAEAAANRAIREGGEAITVGDAPPAQPVLLDSKRMLSPPRYPTGLMRAGVSGAVLLHLRLNPDGTVADVVASQSSLFDIKGSSSILDKARGLLEKESIRVARSWTWQVHAAHPELLTANDLTVRVPIEFRLDAPSKDGGEAVAVWRQEFRGPNLPVPWLVGKAGQQLVGVSDLTGGEQVAGSSVFQLSDRSVLGRAL
jgi:hypothetical protein